MQIDTNSHNEDINIHERDTHRDSKEISKTGNEAPENGKNEKKMNAGRLMADCRK